MKTYDITIKLTLVELCPPPDARDLPERLKSGVEYLVAHLAHARTSTAVKFDISEIVDRDSLPRQA